jgi:putative transposase
MTTGKKRKRHAPAEVVKKLQDADRLLNAGKSLGEVLQVLEVSEATYHRWRTQYGGMKSAEAKRLKELELENARLKKLLAEAELDKAMLKELASGNW